MANVLVTGATGTLGGPTSAALRAAGHTVRGLSRRGGPGVIAADLLSDGSLDHDLDAAFAGVDTVVHCAQSMGRRDVAMAEAVVAHSLRARLQHVILISIVGIEDVPIPYYRQRLDIERVVEASGLPFTIQRATQFHQLIETIITAQRRLPVVVLPAIDVQPVAATDVAARLAEIAGQPPRGRAPDIGGPQTRPFTAFYAEWKHAVGGRRGCISLPIPGAAGRAYRSGVNVVPGRPYGTTTFAHYLAARRDG